MTPREPTPTREQCACIRSAVYELRPEGWLAECLRCGAKWLEPHISLQRRAKVTPSDPVDE